MQANFSDLEYAGKKRVTRRDRFLREIEAVTPWLALVAEIEPFYPKGEGRGRPPIGVHRMLRMYSEMHQTKKGNQWHFGMKAHIGVDADSGLTHTLVTTAANVSDITQAHALLHGDETTAFGDAGYQGVQRRQENEKSAVTWHVALRPGKRRTLPDTKTGRLREQLEKLKASVRAKVEHPFHVVKNIFGHKKARYRGLAKNTAQLHTLFGLANLMIAKRRLFELHTQGAS